MKRILDFGSGEGYFTYVLSKKKDSEVIGIDLSSKNISISKKRYPKVNFIKMNGEKMRFGSNYFDEIYAMDILEHVDNLDIVLKEIRRVLRIGGKFIINIPYYKSEKWLLGVRPTYFKEIHHVRIFKEKELETILRKMGFKVEMKKHTGFLQHVLLYYLFKRKVNSKHQTSIGSWRDNYKTKFVSVFMLHFDHFILKTPFLYFPLWIITLPIGEMVNYFGNKHFPKSLYYKFIKIK